MRIYKFTDTLHPQSKRATLALTRTVSGLLLKQDFDDVSGWTATGVFAQNATRPAYVTAPRSAIKCQVRGGVGEPDHSGVREQQITILPSGQLMLNTGQGNGSGSGGPTTGYPWRPMWAYANTIPTSPSSWTKLYSLGVNCRVANDPSVNYPARDFLFMIGVSGTFYASLMYAENVFADPDDDVPMVPYGTDIFTNPNPLTSNWTWVKKILAPNTGADGSSYTGSWPLLGYLGNNYIFSSETDGPPITDFQLTYASFDTWGGTYTKSGVKIRSDSQLENPKIWWSATLNTYAKCAFELGPSPSFNILNNTFFYGSNPLDWSSDTKIRQQRACGADAAGLVNLPCPFMGSNGLVYETSDGFVPMTFDGGVTTYNAHEGYWTALEPSPYNYRFDSTTGVVRFDDTFNRPDGALGAGWASFALPTGGDFTIVSSKCDCGSAVLPKAQIVKDSGGTLISKANAVAVMKGMSCAANCGVGIVFRAQDTSNFLLCGIKVGVATNAISFYSFVAGIPTLIYTVNYNSSALSDTPFDFTLVFNSTTYTIYINGVSVDSRTNATPITTAGNIGMRNGEAGVGNRLVDEFIVTDIADTTKNTTMYSLPTTDFIAEWAYEPITIPSSSQVGFIFRASDASNGYQALSDNAGNDVLQKIVTGTGTTIGSNTAGVTTVANFQSRFKVKALGTALSYYVDGDLRRSGTDATYANGTKVGLMGSNANGCFRRLAIYTTDTVTITGLRNGQVVTLVAADWIPIATGTVSGTSITLSAEHFPCHGIMIDGVYKQTSSLIYGGDTWAVTQ